MRKIGLLLGLLAALVMAPAAAQATTSTTFNLHGAALIDVGPAGCVAGDLWFTAGNVVEHQTVNNAGDAWVTATASGSFVDPSAGFVGSGSAWFGLDANNRNFATQFFTNVMGTLPNGSTLRIHQTGQFTLNAVGVPVVNNVTVTCG